MQKNFYYVDNITPGDPTTDDPSPISEKYGVFVGNAVFIGVPVVDTIDYVPDLPV